LDDKILDDILNNNNEMEEYKDNAIYILQNDYEKHLSVLFLRYLISPKIINIFSNIITEQE